MEQVPLVRGLGVVYFDQRKGALHAVSLVKSFLSALKKFFYFFPSQTEKKKDNRDIHRERQTDKTGGAFGPAVL